MTVLPPKNRLLGLAFLLQFLTSLISGAVLADLFFSPVEIAAGLPNISAFPWLFKLRMLIDITTAIGILFLAVMLFRTVKNVHSWLPVFAMMVYIVEAVLLVLSQADAMEILGMVSSRADGPSSRFYLDQIEGLIQRMTFLGTTLHMIFFCVGAFVFYLLLGKAKVIPRMLAVWGIITVPLLLVFSLLAFFDIQVPFWFYLPYVPYELVLGIWIFIKGAESKLQATPAM